MKIYHFSYRWALTKHAIWPDLGRDRYNVDVLINKLYAKELLICTCFYVSLILMTYQCSDEQENLFIDAINNLLFSDNIRQTDQFVIHYKDLVMVPEFWSYFGVTLIKNLYKEVSYNNQTNALSLLNRNILLGPPRFRQLRVKKGSCDVHSHFYSEFDTCYSEFSAIDEDTETFLGIEHKTAHELKVTPYEGHLHTYSGGGYVVQLTHDLKKNLEIMEDLRKKHWIDQSTRLVVFEMSLVNEFGRIIGIVKAGAEFSPVGGLFTSSSIEGFRLFSVFTSTNFFYKIFNYSMFLICLALHTDKVCHRMRVRRCIDYLRNTWNVIDLLICLMLWPCLPIELFLNFIGRYILTQARESLVELFCLDYVATLNRCYHQYLAVILFCVTVKFLKYLGITRIFLLFTLSIHRSIKHIIAFLMVYAIIILAYSYLGKMLFHKVSVDFNNFSRAFFIMLEAANGGYYSQYLEDHYPISTPIFFVSFFLIHYCIYFNILMAIVSNSVSKAEAEKLVFSISLMDFFKHFINVWVMPVFGHIGRLLGITKLLEQRIPLISSDESSAKGESDSEAELDVPKSDKRTLLMSIRYANEELLQIRNISSYLLQNVVRRNKDANYLLRRLAGKERIYELFK